MPEIIIASISKFKKNFAAIPRDWQLYFEERSKETEVQKLCE